MGILFFFTDFADFDTKMEILISFDKILNFSFFQDKLQACEFPNVQF